MPQRRGTLPGEPKGLISKEVRGPEKVSKQPMTTAQAVIAGAGASVRGQNRPIARSGYQTGVSMRIPADPNRMGRAFQRLAHLMIF